MAKNKRNLGRVEVILVFVLLIVLIAAGVVIFSVLSNSSTADAPTGIPAEVAEATTEVAETQTSEQQYTVEVLTGETLTFDYPTEWFIETLQDGEIIVVSNTENVIDLSALDNGQLAIAMFVAPSQSFLDIYAMDPTNQPIAGILEAIFDQDFNTETVTEIDEVSPLTINNREGARRRYAEGDAERLFYTFAIDDDFLVIQGLAGGGTLRTLQEVTERLVESVRYGDTPVLEATEEASEIELPELRGKSSLDDNFEGTFTVNHPREWQGDARLISNYGAFVFSNAAAADASAVPVDLLVWAVPKSDIAAVGPDDAVRLLQTNAQGVVDTQWAEPEAANFMGQAATQVLSVDRTFLMLAVDEPDALVGLILHSTPQAIDDLRPTLAAIALSAEYQGPETDTQRTAEEAEALQTAPEEDTAAPQTDDTAEAGDTTDLETADVAATSRPPGSSCLLRSAGSVNRRTGPGTSFESVGGLLPDEVAIAVAQATDDSNFIWWQLEDGSWVREDVVIEDETCENLPRASA